MIYCVEFDYSHASVTKLKEPNMPRGRLLEKHQAERIVLDVKEAYPFLLYFSYEEKFEDSISGKGRLTEGEWTRTAYELAMAELADALNIDLVAATLMHLDQEQLVYVLSYVVDPPDLIEGWTEYYLWFPVGKALLEIEEEAWKSGLVSFTDQAIATTRFTNLEYRYYQRKDD